MSRENIKLITVAAFCVVVGLGAVPAVAAVQQAVNADKVDGKHAVGAGASVNNRKGKLVATSKTTGLLPNNIIGTAPDADKFAGLTPSSYKQMSVNVFGAHLDGATIASTGVVLQPGNGARWSFTLPNNHATADPVYIDLNYQQTDAPCDSVLTTGAFAVDGSTGVAENKFAQFPMSGSDIVVDPSHPTGSASDVRIWFNGGLLAGGSSVIVRLGRASGNVLDTCGAPVVVTGFRVSY